MDASLNAQLQAAQPLLAALWSLVDQTLVAADLPVLSCSNASPSRAEVRVDGYDQSQALFLEWRSPSGGYLGQLVVHGNGQSYAEFDVLQPHPQKPQWVVEAVVVWGPLAGLKSELRLLPALGE